MDLLGSIMDSMDKPPSLTEKERMIIKKRKEEIERRQKENKDRLQRFKERVEAKLISHFDDSKNTMLKFEPMDQICRSIVHEAAEQQNLLSYAFGTDGVDRYIRVYRKDHPPCEDELAARRRGEPWNEQIKQQLIRDRELKKLEELESIKPKPKADFTPNSNYKDKYAHLIGQDAALEAARKTQTNKSYGFVPSENKKDHRSIEQTMADIRAKRRKVEVDKCTGQQGSS
ncbi:sperm-associated antigen 7 [Cylas formicarius]|uniref:sperm-associated antigen 7 n=1 Tax=Cylas formicarius TaxID=197179 RepID=UPI0029584D8B|nr:sperm-associated antigen 7 [Cylas formicarius]